MESPWQVAAGVAAAALLAALVPLDLSLEVRVRGGEASWRASLRAGGLSLARRAGASGMEEAVAWLVSLARSRRRTGIPRQMAGLPWWFFPGLGGEGWVARAGGRVARRARLADVAVSGCLGVGDAAATALLVGAVNAVGGALPMGMAAFSPLFGSAGFALGVRCIWRVRVGDVILACGLALLDHCRRGRWRRWRARSIPWRA